MKLFGFYFTFLTLISLSKGDLSLSPPTYIQFLDPDKNPVTGYSIIKYDVLPKTTFISDGPNVVWSITPDLPQGIVFSYNTLSGSPSVVTGLVKYNVTATNSAGSISRLFELEVKDCPYGSFMGFYLPQNANIAFELSNTEFYLNGTIKGGSTNRFCIPYFPLRYMFNATWSTSDHVGLQAKNELNVTYFSVQMQKYEAITGIVYLGLHKKPTISFPSSVVTAYQNESLSIPVTIIGQWNDYVVSSNQFIYDPFYSVLKGTVTEKGIFEIEISFQNEYGVSSAKVTLKVDTCFSDEHLIVLARGKSSDHESIQFSSLSEVLYSTVFSYNEFKHNLCLTEGVYMITLESRTSGGGWFVSDPLYVFDEKHNILATEVLHAPLQTIDRPFYLIYPIPFGSTFRYCYGFPSEKWMQLKYPDTTWSEGKKGEWGEKKDSSIFLRKVFSLPYKTRFSQLIIKLQTIHRCSVFINGELLLDDIQPLSEDIVYFTVSATALQSKNNILAIQLDLEDSEFVVFDISIQPVMSACLLQSYEGMASDDQGKPDPAHPPSAAFDLNPQTFWSSTQLPVSLDYSFTNERYAVMNQLVIFKQRESPHLPTSFSVEGVFPNTSTRTLFEYNSTLGFQGEPGYAVFSFSNTYPFQTYRFHIFDSLSHSTVQFSDIRLYGCVELTCKKKHGFESTPVGTTQFARCPFNTVGIKQGHCKNHNNSPTWEEDYSACVPFFAEPGTAYLDWSFRLHTISKYAWSETVSQGIKEIISTALTIKEREIAYPFVKDVSSSDEWILDISVRFTLEVEIGSYVKKHMPDLLSNFTGLIREKYSIPYPLAVAETINQPVLRLPFPVLNTIIIVSISILVIIYVVYRCVRMRKNAHSQKVEETAHLLYGV